MTSENSEGLNQEPKAGTEEELTIAEAEAVTGGDIFGGGGGSGKTRDKV